MARDRRRLGRRLDAAGRGRRAHGLTRIAEEIGAAEERITRRRLAVPTLTYPESLPVSRQREEILAAVRDHQVVVLAGETGSGKTTQLPKICLELGRGIRGLIGHTQPRRIAARSVAERVAEELGTPLGEVVGYQVRFTDRVGENTLVKLMTDGILLAEIQGDPLLERYDTIIIDEAHERSLNIDFLLGYLTQLLPAVPTSNWSSRRRPSTRIGSPATSATPRSSRSPGGPTRSRPGTDHWVPTGMDRTRTTSRRTPGGGPRREGPPGHGVPPRGGRPEGLPAGGTARRGTRSRGSARRSRSCAPRALATSSSSSAGSGRFMTPPRPSAG